MGQVLQLDPAGVTRFRIARAGLGAPVSRRTPLPRLIPLGLQDTADHAAAWALAVRREDPRPDDVASLVRDGALVPTWGPRFAATLVPAAHEPLVGHALAEDVDAPDGRREQLQNPGDVARLAIAFAPRAVEIVRRTPLTKADLGTALSGEVPAWAVQACVRCGRDHPADALVKAFTWTGRLRLEPPTRGRSARIAPVSTWRPRRYRRTTDADRRELLLHHLRRHGPSSPDLLAAWAGIEPRWARRLWKLVSDHVVPVRLDGTDLEALAADVDELRDAPDPPPARLVPPYDPLLQAQQGDRGVLVPDARLRRQVWRAVANPGIVLERGTVVGTWRARVVGGRLQVVVTAVGRLSTRTLGALEPDAAAIAAIDGLGGAEVRME